MIAKPKQMQSSETFVLLSLILEKTNSFLYRALNDCLSVVTDSLFKIVKNDDSFVEFIGFSPAKKRSRMEVN